MKQPVLLLLQMETEPGCLRRLCSNDFLSLSLSLSLLRLAAVSLNLGRQLVRKQSAEGEGRLQETQRGTMLMIKDQLIRHLLCNLK